MTNAQIIKKAVVESGMMTAEEYANNGPMLYTFNEWKKMGFSVKKGEKAVLTVYLWKYKTKKKTADETATAKEQPINENEIDGDEFDNGDFYKTKAHLFAEYQVEETSEREKRQAEIIAKSHAEFVAETNARKARIAERKKSGRAGTS